MIDLLADLPPSTLVMLFIASSLSTFFLFSGQIDTIHREIKWLAFLAPCIGVPLQAQTHRSSWWWPRVFPAQVHRYFLSISNNDSFHLTLGLLFSSQWDHLYLFFFLNQVIWPSEFFTSYSICVEHFLLSLLSSQESQVLLFSSSFPHLLYVKVACYLLEPTVLLKFSHCSYCLCYSVLRLQCLSKEQHLLLLPKEWSICMNR